MAASPITIPWTLIARECPHGQQPSPGPRTTRPSSILHGVAFPEMSAGSTRIEQAI